MPPRFWTDAPLVPGAFILDGPEAHHLTHVLRMSTGDSVELCDGCGHVAEAIIATVAKRSVTLDIRKVLSFPPLVPRITLAVAVPKGERFDWLVEKAAELGVSRLIPLRTERGTVDPRDSKLDRLRQVVIAACKQSRNPWAMELSAPITWADWLAMRTATSPLLIADPTGTAWSISGTLSEIEFAIGPEGGWTAEELAAGERAGGQRVSLGPTILRIETAAIVAAGLVRGSRIHAD